MAKSFAHARFAIGALALLSVVAVAAPVRRSSSRPRSIRRQARSRKSSFSTRSAKRGSIRGASRIPDAEVRARSIQPGRPRLARTFIRSRCSGSAPSPSSACSLLLVVFYLIRGMVRIEKGRSGQHDRALQCVRALRALDDGDLLHRAGDQRPQHHLRQVAAAAADRAGGLHRIGRSGANTPTIISASRSPSASC